MALDPSTYVGYPDSEVVFGQLVQTGLAGPSRVGDYQWAVYDQSGRLLTDPNMVLPPGARVSFGYPASQPSQTGGEAVTGSQILLDAETIRASQDASRLAQEQLNLQRDQLAQQAAQFDRQFAASQADAQRRYELDKAMLGEQTAARLFNERMAEARQRLDEQRFALEQKRAELEQKAFEASRTDARFARQQAIAGQKMDILNMLAERSGPQDWVAYNNLLNGLSGPEAQASQTIDVFDILRDLQAQLEADFGSGSGQQQPGGQPPADTGSPQGGGGAQPGSSGGQQPGGGTGTGSPQGGTQPQPDPQAGAAPQAAVYGGPPAGNPYLPYGNPAFTEMGWATPQDVPGAGQVGAGSPYAMQQGAQPAQAAAPGSTMLDLQGLYQQMLQGGGQIPGLAQGGATNTTAVVAGESSTGQMNPEIVLNPTGAPMGFIPIRKLFGIDPRPGGGPQHDFGNQGATTSGTPADLFPGSTRGRPVDPQPGGGPATGRDPTGGVPPGGPATTPPSTAPPAPAPMPVGETPRRRGRMDIRSLMEQWRAGQANRWADPMARPRLTPEVWDAALRMPPPQTAPIQYGVPGGDLSLNPNAFTNGGPYRPPAMQSPFGFGPTGIPMPGFEDGGTMGPKGTHGARHMDVRGMVEHMRDEGMPMAESGGVYNAGEQIGTSQYTFNRYRPEDYRNLPFIRKLTGEMDSAPFRGFGATLQNRNLGIDGFPDMLNVRTLMELAPSEQAMASDLYNRGLGVSFDDVVARSRAAAPGGAALPTAVYGR
ncbi:MAG: hypothetical protein AB7I13_07640 [Vicinamibacterales bacterium]